MSQKELVYNFMKSHGPITHFKAMNQLQCYRLAARIFELKQDGIALDETWKRDFNNRLYKEYRLA